jgi:hypothetical protein
VKENSKHNIKHPKEENDKYITKLAGHNTTGTGTIKEN